MPAGNVVVFALALWISAAAAPIATALGGGADGDRITTPQARDAGSERISVRTERAPARSQDGRRGWVALELTGEVGGGIRGRLTLVTDSRTVNEIRGGTLVRIRAGYEIRLEGTTRVESRDGAASTPFSGRMVLEPSGDPRTRRGDRPPYEVLELVPHTITYTATDGDVWIIDGLTCTRNGDLVCT